MVKFEQTSIQYGLAAAAAVVLLIYIGSGALVHFDAELLWYAAATALTAFAVAYRFSLWMQRPPTRMYFKRGWMFLKQGKAFKRNSARFDAKTNPTWHPGRNLAENFVAQKMIYRRSSYRWIMHLCLSGGCTLAFAITFLLVFGWVHFETLPQDAEVYRTYFLGMPAGQFAVHSWLGFLTFNALNIAAVVVLVGLALAFWRRLTDRGEMATQTFTEDFLPLLLILAVTATGLMLTASYKLMAGAGHSLLAWIHLISVVALLFYLPFGKLFHAFQRICALCVGVYKREGSLGEQARCRLSGKPYASRMHVEDLKTVLEELGFDYRFQSECGEVHYQDVSPESRRKLLALNQGRSLQR